MNYVVVLPSIYQEYTDACVSSMASEFREHLMIVDNTTNNIGVAPAWNNGIQKMYDENADWLIILSAAIRFGDQGGMDLVRELESRPDHVVLEATHVFGWHLIAFHRSLFDKVGKFDENLGIYFNDIDFSLRIQKAYNQQNAAWDKVDVKLQDMGMAHGVKLAGVHEAADPKILYFVQKWGRHPGAYQLGSYETPFNEIDRRVNYWPSINGRSCER